MIGSIGARFTPPFVGPLAASKSALATLSDALRQELAPWGIGVTLIEPGSIRSEAVDELESDARAVLDDAPAEGRALYEGAFLHLVSFFAGIHEKGSSPEVVGATVEHALRASRLRTATCRERRAADGHDRPAAAGASSGRAAPQARQPARPRSTRGTLGAGALAADLTAAGLPFAVRAAS